MENSCGHVSSKCRFFVSTSASRRNGMPKKRGTGHFSSTYIESFFRLRLLPRSLIGTCTRPTEETNFPLPSSKRLISFGSFRILRLSFLARSSEIIFFPDPESGQATCSCPSTKTRSTCRFLALRVVVGLSDLPSSRCWSVGLARNHSYLQRPTFALQGALKDAGMPKRNYGAHGAAPYVSC